MTTAHSGARGGGVPHRYGAAPGPAPGAAPPPGPVGGFPGGPGAPYGPDVQYDPRHDPRPGPVPDPRYPGDEAVPGHPGYDDLGDTQSHPRYDGEDDVYDDEVVYYDDRAVYDGDRAVYDDDGVVYDDEVVYDDGYDPEHDDGYEPEPRPDVRWLLVAVALGTLVSVGLGVYGRVHTPTGAALNLVGFSSGLAAKAWLGSLAFLFALVQLATAVRGYRPDAHPRLWTVHRWSGRIAVLVTVPVAVHCLYALGFSGGTPRALAHSIAGCLLYGAFVAKMLVLQRPGAPRWSLPLLGGLLFTAITVVWLTSSLWFFGTSGLTF